MKVFSPFLILTLAISEKKFAVYFLDMLMKPHYPFRHKVHTGNCYTRPGPGKKQCTLRPPPIYGDPITFGSCDPHMAFYPVLPEFIVIKMT